MPTLVDMIEKYICSLIEASREGAVEIQRVELAEKFRCVPSQISYVLYTRFTPERGYIVESKRGGGGYIRIVRVPYHHRDSDLLAVLRDRIGDYIDQRRAENIIEGLLEDDLISPREAALLRGAVRREAIAVDLPLRDALRARILYSMLASLLSAGVRDGQPGAQTGRSGVREVRSGIPEGGSGVPEGRDESGPAGSGSSTPLDGRAGRVPGGPAAAAGAAFGKDEEGGRAE